MTAFPPEQSSNPGPSAAAVFVQPSKPPRPVGLTVLAVFNFVVGAIGAMALFGLAMTQGWITKLTGDQIIDWRHYLMMFMRLATVLLAFASGVGYLAQEWMSGWLCGNAYALVSILNAILYAVLLHEFDSSSLFWLVYPVLTLFLLNFGFRRNFLRPAGQ